MGYTILAGYSYSGSGGSGEVYPLVYLLGLEYGAKGGYPGEMIGRGYIGTENRTELDSSDEIPGGDCLSSKYGTDVGTSGEI